MKRKIIPKWFNWLTTGLMFIAGYYFCLLGLTHLSYYGLTLNNLFIIGYGMFTLSYGIISSLAYEINNIKVQGGFK